MDAANNLPEKQISDFQDLILSYFHDHERDLPWRYVDDAYKILVSEIMLQQTQSARVIPKYEAFLTAFPTVQGLAEASLVEVLGMWQGLGYNRRGQALQKAAQEIVSRFSGVVPKNLPDLVSLPGIGSYTAAAICAFAYGQPVVMIETNIRRVYIHHFLHDAENIHDNQLVPLISQTIYKEDPRSWYYALMDYGAYLATQIPNPNRRSKHYAKQSKFNGSIRQVRGAIIRTLTRGAMERANLESEVNVEADKFEAAYMQLIKDNLIVEEKQVVRIT